MPDDTVDNPEVSPDAGTTDDQAQDATGADAGAAPQQDAGGTTAVDDAGSGDLILGKFKTQEDLERGYQELERRFHERESAPGQGADAGDSDEPTDPFDLGIETASKDAFGEPSAETDTGAQAQAGDVDQGGMGEALQNAILAGDTSAIEFLLRDAVQQVSTEVFDNRMGARDQMQADRETARTAYPELFAKHDAAARAAVAQGKAMNYRNAFAIVARGDMISAEVERRMAETSAAKGQNGGRAMTGGRPSGRQTAADAEKAARDAIVNARPADSESGRFNELFPPM
jgi:hypothetical protein